ncbi:hypothetical protein BMW22_15735 [Rhizobium leguminosarum]|uniref:Uncharacterized protein n=1 Tax=Rhizobium leguminosarum TaxID=384 RepID=A0A1L3ZB12_RHILE|nr:hypothetical protein [Rhizobium leguminosarum]API52876.1 hypothetical protein BMW22_15735 [Rhizobium leguminosarum]
MIEESISKTFTQRDLDGAQKETIRIVSLRFSQIEEALNTIPPSRLRSLALTEIEKVALVVNKAISRANDPA